MTARRPFRFGVVAAQARSGQEWVEKGRRAEALGYATLVMPDTLGQTLTPIPALGVLAGATGTLRLGTYVLANDFRNPVLLAREAAALDHLSSGRFELGLGAGRPGVEGDYAKLGIPFESGGVRVSRLAEAVGVIKGLLHGGDVFPRPVQERLPIVLAASGPRLLALAAREADVVAIGATPQEGEAGVRERVARLREAAPDRFDQLELNMNLVAVGDRLHPAAARMGGDLEQLARSGSPMVLTGSQDRMAEQLLRTRESLGISYVTVADLFMDAFAPVAERLAGR
ncbi:MAG TPA: TIGR03621 family F420-dependent LLM class oxidoreductase [Candidatus Dormibacteraeota bacterium]|nr:TIGR03621 family F420-dependent LLM class oxidoreductase [Candidatus Dormibacteraeota bacterium]